MLSVINTLSPKLAAYAPTTDLGKLVKTSLRYLPADLAEELLETIKRSVVMQSALYIKAFRLVDGSAKSNHCNHNYEFSFLMETGVCRKCDGRFAVEDYGMVGNKVVTTVGVGFIVDAFQNSVELENMKYHGLGTGSTAEAVGDSALVTELTTEYTGNVRATGTTTEASATVYETVATNTLDGTPGAALREHGVFSASSSGVLLDRTVYSAITLSSGDGLQSTYDLTCSAGG